MDRAAFYRSLRRRESGVFGTFLSQGQVDGMEALLNAGRGLPLHHLANVLAQVARETGRRMAPVRETFADTDAQAIARLERAWARGHLTWVRTPYWRDGWFGRGQIQLTHESNYRKFGITNPSDALKRDVSARVAVEGMRDGKFTGRKLSDYDFPAALDYPPSRNPRRIVNGQDGSDAQVAGYHRDFAAALIAGGYQPAREVYPAPTRPATTPAPRPTAPRPARGIMATLVAFLRSLRGDA